MTPDPFFEPLENSIIDGYFIEVTYEESVFARDASGDGDMNDLVGAVLFRKNATGNLLTERVNPLNY